MGRRKPHKINIREQRLERLDTTKFEVAVWLLARGVVEDRTRRSQPAPARHEEPTGRVTNEDGGDERRKAAA
jgi:hypothetical protein